MRVNWKMNKITIIKVPYFTDHVFCDCLFFLLPAADHQSAVDPPRNDRVFFLLLSINPRTSIDVATAVALEVANSKAKSEGFQYSVINNYGLWE